MDQYLSVMEQTSLFRTLSLDEYKRAMRCLKGQIISYKKGQTVVKSDEKSQLLGIILEGTVCLVRTTFDGEDLYFVELTHGNLFGETAFRSEDQKNGFDVKAVTDCSVLFIENINIKNQNRTNCQLRRRIIENLFHMLLDNNENLYQKMNVYAQKNLRKRISQYLLLENKKHDSRIFTIPFTRNELANYLRSDRSALCRELSKMKNEGLIDFQGNSFKIVNLIQD